MNEQFNLEYCQQEIFEDFDAALFLQFKRSLSNDLIENGFNPLALTRNNKPDNHQKSRNLVLNIEQPPEQTQSKPSNAKFFKKKQKKKRIKGQCDYKKNICGYITKKILREFAGPAYYQKVNELCEERKCSYSSAKSYYLSQIERVTGPSHVPSLIIPESEEQVPIKTVFKQFFVWFLNERYIRYLLVEGKMDQKIVYLKYKNQTLTQILNESAQYL